jgi:hypothetical protein
MAFMSDGTGSTPAAPFAPGALHRALARERLQSTHLVNRLRLWGVSAFFALFLLLGGVLGLHGWTGNLGLFAVYWSIALGVWWVSRRFERVVRSATLALAFVAAPLVFLLQLATLHSSPSASGVAGFTLSLFVLLVIMAALSLERWSIAVTAAIGAVLEIVLQYLADVSVGAMVSTVIVLGLAAAACAHARRRLAELAGRLDHDMAEQRQAEHARRQLEELSALNELSRAVVGQLDRRALLDALRLQGARALDFETLEVMLLEGAGDELEVVLRVADGTMDAGPIHRQPREVGLVGDVIESGRPLRADDHAAEVERRGRRPSDPAARPYWLGVPLVAADVPLGILALGRSSRPFTEAEERAATNIGALTALALRSAWL